MKAILWGYKYIENEWNNRINVYNLFILLLYVEHLMLLIDHQAVNVLE